MLVVAAMCFTAVVTVGRQAAVEASVSRELSGPAALTLTITDISGNGVLDAATVQLLTGMNGTRAVIARDRPVDAVNGALGAGASPVAVVGLHGTIDAALDLTSGRMPAAGEVIVSGELLSTLRMSDPVGYLEATDGTQWSVVGSFEPVSPFGDLATMAVTTPSIGSVSGGDGNHQQVRMVAQDVSHVRAMQQAALRIVDATPNDIQVISPAAAATTSQSVANELAGFGRSLLFLILGVGAFFVAVVVLADVLIRRRDLGRRRTLGITRGDLMTLVTLRTAVPAVAGAVTGSCVGHVLVTVQHGAPPADFTLAVTVLACVTALGAALPPAAYAAGRDPVEVMRTP